MVESKKKKSTSKKTVSKFKKKTVKKTVKKSAKNESAPKQEPFVEVSYEQPQIITTEPQTAEVKIEEIPQTTEPESHSVPEQEPASDPVKPEPVIQTETKQEDLSVQPQPQPQPYEAPPVSDDMVKDKNSGVFVWVAILVVLALIVVIVNLDKIIPDNPDNPINPDQNPSSVVATVNGQDITIAELERFYNLSVPDPLKLSITKETFLEKSLVPQTVLIQEAEKNRIAVSDEEIKAEIDDLAESSGMTMDELMQNLEERGVKEEDLILMYKNKVLIDKLLDQTLLADTEVEIPEMVKASHILVEDKALAESILADLKDGGSFEDLASENSIDSTALNGGDLGYFGKGTMVPEFEEAAFSLEPGQVSDIVETDFGYHIIKLTDKLAGGTMKYSDITSKAQKDYALNEQMPAIQLYTNNLVKQAEVVIIGAEDQPADQSPDQPSETIPSSGEDTADLADCLVSKGAVVYGAEWCEPCVKQKDLFGDSFDKIDSVICTASSNNPQIDKCEKAGIVKYPTWIIGDKKLEGFQTLAQLAIAAECS